MSKKNEDKYISGFIRDLKCNKIGYVKSPLIANKISKLAPDIRLEYNREDDIWIAYYDHFD